MGQAAILSIAARRNNAGGSLGFLVANRAAPFVGSFTSFHKRDSGEN